MSDMSNAVPSMLEAADDLAQSFRRLKQLLTGFTEITENLCQDLKPVCVAIGKTSYKIKNKANAEQFLLIYEEHLIEPLVLSFYKNLISDIKDNIQNVSSPKSMIFLQLQVSLWNVSDLSALVRLNIIRDPLIVKLLIEFMNCQDFHRTVHTCKAHNRYVHTTIGILNNLLTHDSGSTVRPIYRQLGMIDVLKKFIDNDDVETMANFAQIPIAALLLMSFILNDNEYTETVMPDIETKFNRLITILDDTLKVPELYSKTYGYTAEEMLLGLKNLASPDHHKSLLLQMHMLDYLNTAFEWSFVMYRDQLIRAQDLAKNGLVLLWSLSFAQSIHQMTDHPVFQALEVLHKADWLPSYFQTNVQAIMYNLKQFVVVSPTRGLAPKSKHLMISYQHSTVERMLRVKIALEQAGHQVWMDVDNQYGSFFSHIADAVENSSILIMGVCQAFYDSNYCRQETTYAIEHKVPLLPVLLEESFRPTTGWLGFALSTIVYHEFYQHTAENESLARILQAVQNLLNYPEKRESMIRMPSISRNRTDSNSYSNPFLHSLHSDALKSLNGFSPPPLTQQQSALDLAMPTFTRWSRKDFRDWLARVGLDHLNANFDEDWNGELLFEMYQLMMQSPNTYNEYMRLEFNLKLADLLRFTRAFRSLYLSDLSSICE